jgi:hypothetical protein
MHEWRGVQGRDNLRRGSERAGRLEVHDAAAATAGNPVIGEDCNAARPVKGTVPSTRWLLRFTRTMAGCVP